MDGTSAVDDFLMHFGVKGMRWGVRKNPEQAAADKIRKEDRKFEKAAVMENTHVRLWTHSVVTLKKSGDLKKINDKPEYQAAKWRLKFGVARKQLQNKYDDEVAGKLLQHLKKNANELVNRSMTRRMDIEVAHKKAKVFRASTASWRITTRDIQHAEDIDLVIRIVRDALGRIIDMIPESDVVEQSAIDDFMHFGIKGMKWGQRKAHPVTAEAKQKQGVKEKVKKTKVGSVTNAQLQAAIKRMQLEQDFKRLAVNEKSAVGRWISSMLLEAGKREVQAYAAKKLTVGVAKMAIKKVATGGVA